MIQSKDTRLLGHVIIASAILFGVFVFYTVLTSTVNLHSVYLYYSLLVPATIPTVIVFSYWGWVSSQYFRYS